MIHILAPAGDYIGQTRGYGCRRWRTVTGKCRTPEKAMVQAVTKMAGAHRARVLFIVRNGWYEPTLVMQLKR